MLALLIKIFGAPLLIGGASLVGKHYGPVLAGVLSGLPVITGPILAVLWLEQGAQYTAQVAWMLPVGLVPLAAYLWVFFRVSQHRGWLLSLCVGWAVFLLIALLCSALAGRYWLLVGIAIAAIIGVGIALPRSTAVHEPPTLPRVELLARILAAFALVFVLTSATSWLGAEWTGLLAAFPVAGSVMPAFTLANSGSVATLRLLRGFVSGLLGLAGFSLSLALLLPVWGGFSFLPAVLLALVLAWFNSRLVFRA